MPNKTSTASVEQATSPATTTTSARTSVSKAARVPRVKRTVAETAPSVAVELPPVVASPPATLGAEAAPARTRRAPRAPRVPRAHRAARAARPASAPPTLWGVGLSGVGALLALGGLVAMRPVERMPDPWDPVRLVVYALLVLGPAAVFWAMGQAFRMGRFWVGGALAWAAFGYVLIFVPPPPSGQPITAAAVAGLLGLLFLALTAGLTLPLHALGWALFTQRARRQDVRRAVRQAALLAFFGVACLGMSLFSVFNGLNALLLFVVLALAEFFFLSRD